MLRPLLLSGVLLTACTGEISMHPVSREVPAIVESNGAPIEITRPTRSTQGTWIAPSALWLQQGTVAVLDGDTVKQRNGTSFQTLTVGTTDDSRAPGSVRAVTVRGDGVLLAGTGGFFHDAPGHLLRSPLSESFSMNDVKFVDFADGALWVTTANDALRVLDGRKEALKVSDPEESGALQAVVGRTATRALLVRGASLYSVDLSAREVKTLARGIATVTALSRRGEVILLGTSEGLVEIAADDVVTRRSLAAAGDAAQAIVDVEATDGASLITTNTKVLRVTEAAAVVLSDVAQPWPDALTKDAVGDVWLIDGVSVARLSTSVELPPTSFAADVKPFFTAHCRSCHTTGANYAPVIDLENYGTAKIWAQASLNRVTDTLSPMPPTNAEILTPAQYDVVVRWVAGGLLP